MSVLRGAGIERRRVIAYECLLEIPSATASRCRWVDDDGGGGGKCKPGLPGPGEDLFVGPYGRSYWANRRSGLDGTHSAHHVLQNAISRVSMDRGITINLIKELHEITRTFRKAVEKGLTPQTASRKRHKRSAKILREAGYDRRLINQQLRELIRQNRKLGGLDKPPSTPKPMPEAVPKPKLEAEAS